MSRRAWVRAAAAGACLFLPLGCSTAHYKDSADKETYTIIEDKSPSVPGMPESFDIVRDAAWDPLAEAPKCEQTDEALEAASAAETGAAMLSLERALEVAVRNSRTYQTRKEALYLDALALTLERHRYTPIFSATGSAGVAGSTRDVLEPSDFTQVMAGAADVVAQLEELTGTTSDLMDRYLELVNTIGEMKGWDQPDVDVVDERAATGKSNLGVNMLLKGGGRIGLALTSNFLRFLTGSPRPDSSSALSATIAQPLLEGAGSDIAAERLTQAERNVLYALRDFTRFRQEFSVTICSSFYGVLKAKDVARNNWIRYCGFKKSAERERALAAEGRKTQGELGRIEQALLSSENSWLNSVQQYKQSLDRFKIDLGLSTDAAVILDGRELDELREAGLFHPPISSEDAVKVALATRLDLFTAKDQVEDAERGVHVAANALKPKLNLAAGATAQTTGTDGYQDLDFRRMTWDAGLDTDLGLDKKSERNAYRGALISYDRSLREASLSEDTIKLEVRSDWRNLDQAKFDYQSAVSQIELNKRRVEEQDLLAELGRATVLNQVDTRNDLTASQNDLTSALIQHTLARLALWRDMGILYIKPNGQWEEVRDVPGN